MVKRLFIAVDVKPSQELIDFFFDLKETFQQEKIKWVNPEIFHLTLKFLGEPEQNKIPLIIKELEEISKNCNPFGFKVKGLGYFGKRKDPRVLFSNIEGTETLKNLSLQINEKLWELGFKKEQKEFKAHLTFGRIKFIRNLPSFFSEIEKNREIFLQEVMIDEIILYESILKPQGAEYIVIQKFLF